MDYKAWYRQWRPEKFDNVIGQSAIVQTLKNQIISGRIAHAYLFCGPKGTGKTSVARILAHAANCNHPMDGSPCGVCTSCTNASAGDMDIVEIDAASNNGVDDVRELRERVVYPPVNGKHKVYIIDEVHMLSIGAFNALLKTLEEPPSHVLFIFATTEAHKIPATIYSRCQRFNFKRISKQDIFDTLKAIADKINLEYEVIALSTIASWAEGSLRDAISMLDQCNSFKKDVLTNADVLSILGTLDLDSFFRLSNSIFLADVPAVLRQISMIFEEGKDIQVVLRDFISHLRNILIYKVCENPDSILESDETLHTEYLRQSTLASYSLLVSAIEQLSALDSELRWSTQQRIMLEIALLKLCKKEEVQSFSGLELRISEIEKKIGKNFTSEAWSEIDKKNHERANVRQIIQDTLKQDQTNIQNTKIHEKLVVKDTTLAASWNTVIKTLKKERESMAGLLSETKLEEGKNSDFILNFPLGSEFNYEFVNKEDNRIYLETLISKTVGKNVVLKLRISGNNKQDLLTNETDSLVQKVYDMFGQENVEIIDD